jgi:hypothetical protein
VHRDEEVDPDLGREVDRLLLVEVAAFGEAAAISRRLSGSR